ncbi:MAG: hypothetical protein E7115_00230 [Bacteroidales bacterium]|nr:hypothetical protein [Bacteroidales bacterium]
MKRHFENLISRASRVVRHWWLMAIAGVLCILAGIAVFVFPLQSYVFLSIMFGILILFVGASQLIIASTSSNYLAMKGYILAGGVMDLILGIFLCIYPNVTLILLPVMLGIWMMYHSFMIIAFGGDMENFRLRGSKMTIFGGVLLLILSILVLINPFGAGVATVIVLAGVGLIVFGCLFCMIASKLRHIHEEFEIS